MSLNPKRLQLVEEVFDLTRQMGQQTSEKAWEQVAELERERRARLEAVLESVPAEESAEVAEVIRRVMEADRLIIEISNEEKLRLMEDILQLNKGRKASMAYSENP
jgi:predicted nucleotide-binding protein (sugar kinase/HSP70/actin superfamily)